MKKYKKPVLDIVEFDNMDVIMDSGQEDDEGGGDENYVLDGGNSYSTVDPTPGAHETPDSEGPTQNSEESADELVSSEEATPTPAETESDTDTVEPTVEPDTQVEPPSDYGELS